MITLPTATSTATAPSDETPAAAAAGTLSAVDEAFFRMTASLFPPSFVFGAGVLLATYDDDEPPNGTVGHPAVRTVPAPRSVSA